MKKDEEKKTSAVNYCIGIKNTALGSISRKKGKIQHFRENLMQIIFLFYSKIKITTQSTVFLFFFLQKVKYFLA